MKTILLLLAIAGGIIFPYGEKYTFLIRYFLMILLFFAFLDIKIDKGIIQKTHFIILAATIGIAVLIYFLIKPFSIEIAQTAFITAISPTAIAAPVIISLRKRKVEFVAFSLVLNNIVITMLIPFLLTWLIQSSKDISLGEILWPVLITLSIPLAAGQILKIIFPKGWHFLVDWKDSVFYILIANIYIATSDAATYIGSEMTSDLSVVLIIGAISAGLCIFLFSVGYFLGGKEHSAEASQALGQKNNAFTLWIALTFISPLAALGPVFYVLCQNIYISWELYRLSKK
jgi:BASS family bile acid:Na+ symporter